MEGWDANRDGSPSAHTLRRWRNFGRSGAKLIWGGEAAAVRARRPRESESNAGHARESRRPGRAAGRAASNRTPSSSATRPTCSSACN